jgi:hypothetical protein
MQQLLLQQLLQRLLLQLLLQRRGRACLMLSVLSLSVLLSYMKLPSSILSVLLK